MLHSAENAKASPSRSQHAFDSHNLFTPVPAGFAYTVLKPRHNAPGISLEDLRDCNGHAALVLAVKVPPQRGPLPPGNPP